MYSIGSNLYSRYVSRNRSSSVDSSNNIYLPKPNFDLEADLEADLESGSNIELLGSQVTQLQNVSNQINIEILKQNNLIDNIKYESDKTSTQLQNLNKKIDSESTDITQTNKFSYITGFIIIIFFIFYFVLKSY
jgi:hypothetical protein